MFGLCREVAQGVQRGNLDMSAPEFPVQAPGSWRGVCLESLLASTGTLAGKVHQDYSPAPPTPACPGFEENAVDLDGFQDAGCAWAVATVCAEVKRCRQGEWVRKREASLVYVEEAELSGKLTPAAGIVGVEGGLVIEHAKSFRLLK